MVSEMIIVGIRIIAAVIFLITSVMAWRVHSKTKGTDIWFLIATSILILFIDSTVNALEWANIAADAMDKTGEYIGIIFSLIWVYVSYRFITLKNK